MRVYRGGSVDEVYGHLVADLLTEATVIPTRLGPATDLGPTTLTIAPGPLKLLSNRGRAIDPRLALLEACWILSGENRVAPLATLAPRFRSFSDDGETLSGAYGERLRQRSGVDQLDGIVTTLREDPHSRRAFALIADPADGRSVSRDVPCNIAIMFRIRAAQLAMTVVNRSNDVIFGVPYDVFSFSLIHFALAQALGVSLGEHVHVANSMHLYESNRDIAERVLTQPATLVLPAGDAAETFLASLVEDHRAIGTLDVEAISNPRLRQFFNEVRSSGRKEPTTAEPDDWLSGLARQWALRPKSSAVAVAPVTSHPGRDGS